MTGENLKTDPTEEEMGRTLWRHKKRGTVYCFVGLGHIEDGWVPSVTYQSIDGGGLITRPITEFLDGRFERYEEQHDTSSVH